MQGSECRNVGAQSIGLFMDFDDFPRFLIRMWKIIRQIRIIVSAVIKILSI